MAGEPTPPQTVGPFFHGSLLREPRDVIAPATTPEERIWIGGRVLDGEGAPVPDAVVEVWQADVRGRYRHPGDAWSHEHGFVGFGRSGTDPAGEYSFETVRPGAVGAGAPHLNVLVFARGLLDRLATRIYFDDDDPAGSDPLLLSVPRERRSTLIARREAADRPRYRHDIVLQGASETVFFDA